MGGEKGDILLFGSLPRAAAGTKGRFKAKFPRGALGPAWPAEGSSTLHARSKGSQFRLGLWLVHEFVPVAGKRQWASR